MLTESAYNSGLILYVLVALAALLLANRWLLRALPLTLRLVLTLPLAALLLTPAYTQAGAETMAPALIVTAFQWATAGREAAEHALRPLLTMTVIGAVAGLALGAVNLLLRRRH